MTGVQTCALPIFGVKANWVISAAFGITGLLASAVTVLYMLGHGDVRPNVGQGPVLVAFVDLSAGQILLSAIAAGGQTWSRPLPVVAGPDLRSPSMLILGDRLVLAFRAAERVEIVTVPLFGDPGPPVNTRNFTDGPDPAGATDVARRGELDRLFELRLDRRLVGGLDQPSADLAATLYQRIVEQVVPVSSAEVAEAAKLLALAQVRLEEDPTEALAFTTASLELADTEQARVFVIRALSEGPPARVLDGLNGSAVLPAFSRDGRWLAVAGLAEEVLVFQQDGTGPIRLPDHNTSPGPEIGRAHV